RRRLELREERDHLFFDLVDAADIGERAAPDSRSLAHEVAVGRRADADREEPAVAESLVDGREELLLVADRAVGQEDHLPQTAWMLVAVEGLLERRQHFGAAVGADPADVAA